MQALAKNKRTYWIIALVLLILVALTAAYLCMRLGVFSPKEKQDYISLVPTGSQGGSPGSVPGTQGGADPTAATDPTATTGPTEPTFVEDPDMAIYDHEQIWTTRTQIDLFRVAYENDQAVITAVSDDNTKIIAPGTQNSYTFRLKNTGNVALNYSVMMRAYFSDNVTVIPVEVRMRSYYGRYVIGSEDAYAPITELDGLQDHATLGVGSYAYYTLEWQWPFEGNDELDTWLGDLAVTEPVTLTIEINTLASVCEDPEAGGGIPTTGDTFQPVFWGVVCCAAVAGIVVLLIFWKRRRPEDENEG